MKNRMLIVFSLFSVFTAISPDAFAQGNDIRIGRQGYAYNAEKNESYLTICMKPTPSNLDPSALVANCVCVIHNEVTNETTWRKLVGENDRCVSIDDVDSNMAKEENPLMQPHKAEERSI